jgi:phytoene dehydrogenase-like protein
MARDRSTPARLVGGYGRFVDFLTDECRRYGVTIRLNAIVCALEASTESRFAVRCSAGSTVDDDAVILIVPLPLLREIAVPDGCR